MARYYISTPACVGAGLARDADTSA